MSGFTSIDAPSGWDDAYFSGGGGGGGGMPFDTRGSDVASRAGSPSTGADAQGTDWNKVAKALGDLQKQNAPQQSGGSQGPTSTGGQAASSAVNPAHAASMDALLKVLMERRDQYMQAAMSSQRAAVIAPAQPHGLLGF